MTLVSWSWFLLVFYNRRHDRHRGFDPGRVKHTDAFATACAAYEPLYSGPGILGDQRERDNLPGHVEAELYLD